MPKAVSLFLIRYGTQFAARNVRFWKRTSCGLVAMCAFDPSANYGAGGAVSAYQPP